MARPAPVARSPVRRTPTRILLDELLCSIFLAARDLDAEDERWLCSNVRVSHVCRRWRRLALSQARLWDEIRYSADGSPNIHAIKAILRRSQQVSIALHLNFALPMNAVPSVAVVGKARAVARTIVPHFSRAYSLQLYLSVHLWDDRAFAPLLRMGVIQMPSLRRLVAEDVSAALPMPILNITCPPLELLRLEFLSMPLYHPLVNAGTLSVRLFAVRIARSDLVRFIGKLRDIDYMFLGLLVFTDGRGSAQSKAALPTISPDLMQFMDIAASDMPFVRRILPIDNMWSVTLGQYFLDLADSSAWAPFLGVGVDTFGDVVELRLRGDTLELRNARGMARSVVPRDHGQTSRLLSSLLAQLPSLLSTMRTLRINIEDWAPFLTVVSLHGSSLPKLESLSLHIDQGALDGMPNVTTTEYYGPTVQFPVLGAVEVCVFGTVVPRLPLARSYVGFVTCIHGFDVSEITFFGPPMLCYEFKLQVREFVRRMTGSGETVRS